MTLHRPMILFVLACALSMTFSKCPSQPQGGGTASPSPSASPQPEAKESCSGKVTKVEKFSATTACNCASNYPVGTIITRDCKGDECPLKAGENILVCQDLDRPSGGRESCRVTFADITACK